MKDILISKELVLKMLMLFRIMIIRMMIIVRCGITEANMGRCILRLCRQFEM